MAERPTSPPAAMTAAGKARATREKRLAEALRANLKRRKAVAREASAAAKPASKPQSDDLE